MSCSVELRLLERELCVCLYVCSQAPDFSSVFINLSEWNSDLCAQVMENVMFAIFFLERFILYTLRREWLWGSGSGMWGCVVRT